MSSKAARRAERWAASMRWKLREQPFVWPSELQRVLQQFFRLSGLSLVNAREPLLCHIARHHEMTRFWAVLNNGLKQAKVRKFSSCRRLPEPEREALFFVAGMLYTALQNAETPYSDIDRWRILFGTYVQRTGDAELPGLIAGRKQDFLFAAAERGHSAMLCEIAGLYPPEALIRAENRLKRERAHGFNA